MIAKKKERNLEKKLPQKKSLIPESLFFASVLFVNNRKPAFWIEVTDCLSLLNVYLFFYLLNIQCVIPF